jgi:hypothetical protein
MFEPKISNNQRNPYEKKLITWEKQLQEIDIYINKIPDINILNLTIFLIRDMFVSDVIKISEQRENLEKIKSGTQKMLETLSNHKDIDNLSNQNFDYDNYLERLMEIEIKIDLLIKKIPEKDVNQFIQSFIKI